MNTCQSQTLLRFCQTSLILHAVCFWSFPTDRKGLTGLQISHGVAFGSPPSSAAPLGLSGNLQSLDIARPASCDHAAANGSTAFRDYPIRDPCGLHGAVKALYVRSCRDSKRCIRISVATIWRWLILFR